MICPSDPRTAPERAAEEQRDLWAAIRRLESRLHEIEMRETEPVDHRAVFAAADR